MREGKKTYAFFLDVQKAYDTVWRNGLWVKLWDLGVRGRMWRVIKRMYEASRSAVLLDGEKPASLILVLSKVWHRVVVYPQFYFQCLSMIS